MTTIQKVIKYLAIALALFIIFNIFYGAIELTKTIVTSISNEINNKEEIKEGYNIISNDLSEINTLKILNDNDNIEIKIGDSFKVITNDLNVKYNYENGTATISSESNLNLIRKNRGNIIIYIPDNYNFNNVELHFGAGKLEVEKLSVNELTMELGAGKVNIDNLSVLSSAKITGGAGNIKIEDCIFNNLNLKLGIGNTKIEGNLLGNNSITTGVGKLSLDLTNNLDNYSFTINKGIGNIKIDDNEVFNSNSLIGNGVNKISINGGIGNVDITTNN